jgi:hypothetical protein
LVVQTVVASKSYAGIRYGPGTSSRSASVKNAGFIGVTEYAPASSTSFARRPSTVPSSRTAA